MTEGQRRLAAIMFTDIVGFSALTHQDEALALDVLQEQRRLLDPIFSAHDGKQIKTLGDGCLVEFSSALQAVQCAIDIQRALGARNRTAPHGRSVRLRIGIHLGDIEHRDGDVFGDGVNIASRLVRLSEPGGICISEDVARQIRTRLDLRWASMGRPALKNIHTRLEVFQLQDPSLTATALPPLAPALQSAKSLAVLPFVDLSPAGDNEYFADGITEELIDAFAKLKGLKVISRTSAFALKGKSMDMRQIGAQLGVETVLEGSVRKAGDRLRITAQLIQVDDDAHLWSDRFDRQLGDVIAIQEEIAQAIVQTLEPKLLRKKTVALLKHPLDTKVEAYQLYLRARYFQNKGTNEGFQKAIECYTLALELDSQYALVHAGLAQTYALLAAFGHMPVERGCSLACDHAHAALAIDDTLDEAHIAAGRVVHWYELDLAQAAVHYQRALELNPGSANAHHSYANYLRGLKRFDEAVAHQKIALDLDPLSLQVNRGMGWTFYYARRYEEALAALHRTIELDPHFPVTRFLMGLVRLQQSHLDEALAEFGRETHPGYALTGTAIAFARAGNRDRAAHALSKLVEQYEEHVAYQIAQVLFQLNETDRGFQWLERAQLCHDAGLQNLEIDPLLDGVRAEGRYRTFLAKVGLEPAK